MKNYWPGELLVALDKKSLKCYNKLERLYMPSTYTQRLKQGWEQMGELIPSRYGRAITILRFGRLIAPEAFEYSRAISRGESPECTIYSPDRLQKFGDFIVKRGGELPAPFTDSPQQ